MQISHQWKLTSILVTLVLITACTSGAEKPTHNIHHTTESAMQPPSISITSQYSFIQTEARLREGLARRNLTLFTVVDHGLGAKSVGLDIGDNKLFIFGNPKAGTLLMEENSKMGLILPLKILLTLDKNGNTVISYTHISEAAAAHDITDKDALLQKISQGLDGLAGEITGN